MSDLGWRADGIARALACGGVELERYHRPGFTAGMGVRRASEGTRAEGFDTEYVDPAPEEWERARGGGGPPFEVSRYRPLQVRKNAYPLRHPHGRNSQA
jgi:hypothetical protein